jgi:hypothetical protein
MLKTIKSFMLGAAPALVFAAFPDELVHLVVPYFAHGPTEAMARILQAPLSRHPQ